MTAVMESPVLIPGSFMPEQDIIFQRTCSRSSIFLPPTADSPHPATPTSKIFSSQPIPKPTDLENNRKRPRLNTNRSYQHSALRNNSYTSTQTPNRDILSPPPFVNTNYRMAGGGLDAHCPTSVPKEQDDGEYDFEVDCRPDRFSQRTSHPTDSYFPYTPRADDRADSSHLHTPRASEGGRIKRKQPSNSPKGWGKTVWALTGGIAGKVLDFCWNTTFKGFYAGGGDGYRLDIGTPDIPSTSTWTEVDNHEDVFHTDYNAPAPRRGERAHTPVPGGFPEDRPNFLEDYMSNPSLPRTKETWANATPTTETTLRHDWVVIDAPGANTSRESSPVRKKSRASTANMYARPGPTTRHVSASARPRLASRSSTSHRSSASFASPRTTSLHTTTAFSSSVQPRQSLSASTSGNLQGQAHTPSSAKRPSSRASLASPRRYASQPATAGAGVSPKPSPEVRKFEQKLRRKEAKQDQTMNRFNAQLQAMIREGQQALGAKVEVDVEGTEDVDLDDYADVEIDEGYAEGDGGYDNRNRNGVGSGKRLDRCEK